MPKNAISVTLDRDNLVWLQARARAGHARSVSDLLDRIVTEARSKTIGAEVKSVVGTIDIDPSDPDLSKADEYIQSLFAESLRRPFLVKEQRAAYGRPRRKRRG
jgi:hypothetical protein